MLVQLYVNEIEAEKIGLDDVPAKLQTAVEAEISKRHQDQEQSKGE